jgi:hypothetical protein
MRKILACLGGTALLLAGTNALAHHSFAAEYDADDPIQLKGKVTEMKWSNPHGWIYLDVEDEQGNVTNWALETSAANGLIRRGWRRDDLPAGTVLLVDGWRARNGSNTGNIRSVTFEDGRRLFAGTSNQSVREE